jgi:alpha-L-rhamnosidase
MVTLRSLVQCATLLGCLLPGFINRTAAAPTHLVGQSPVCITNVAPGIILVDFGRVAFGNIQFTPPPGATGEIKVHFGEAFAAGRIDRNPPGSVRYAMTSVTLAGNPLVVAPAPDKRNTTHPPAILTPPDWGTVLPFRWVEIEGWPGELIAPQIIRQAAFAETWDDEAAAFHCSDEVLNRIWDLCRYSIKATTFAGVYVDGDRERIPYEADAYLNQLSHYYTDRDTQMARDTFDYLMKHGTWPTEWAPHMVFMAYADWMQTGDTDWLAARYDDLKSKLLMDRVGSEGLVRSANQHVTKYDIVDWPKGERDDYVFTELNTVVNAFHIRSLQLMADMGRALGRDADASEFAAREARARPMFREKFFGSQRGLYRDGATTEHVSLHANLFPLAFELVPEVNRANVAEWLAQRGMKCSVYAAQYLLEGLFQNGQGAAAIDLMIAPGDRSWLHMVESGTTITWEAWDQKYKPNQDWNHAWGAAPANLLPRYVLGVQVLKPGWKQALIQPHPGSLTTARGKVPTPLGPVLAGWKREHGFELALELPQGMTARVELPAIKGAKRMLVNEKPAIARIVNDHWVLAEVVSGKVTVKLK